MPMARGCLFQTRTHPCSYSTYLPTRRIVEGAERGASISFLRCCGRWAAVCGCVEMVDMVICLPLPTFRCRCAALRCAALRTRSVPDMWYGAVCWWCLPHARTVVSVWGEEGSLLFSVGGCPFVTDGRWR